MVSSLNQGLPPFGAEQWNRALGSSHLVESAGQTGTPCVTQSDLFTQVNTRSNLQNCSVGLRSRSFLGKMHLSQCGKENDLPKLNKGDAKARNKEWRPCPRSLLGVTKNEINTNFNLLTLRYIFARVPSNFRRERQRLKLFATPTAEREVPGRDDPKRPATSWSLGVPYASTVLSEKTNSKNVE